MDLFRPLSDNNPFDGIDLGFQAVPTLVDIDGDGDLDAIVGENDGDLNFFENVGDATNPSFVQRNGADSPVNDIGDLGSDSVPNFVDIDGDGDLDAFIGLQDNNVSFFENVGDATTPSFIQRIGVDNPLDLVNVADDAAPTFVDIDGDGDLDVILGEGEGTLLFFENVGDANTPTFEERIGVDNPLDGVDVGIDAIPTTTDFDGDGDFDVIVGDSTGSLSFFENTGDASNPSFTERIGADNPLDEINVDRQSAPTFVDIDGDSDLDIIIGDRNGQIQTFLNADGPFDGFDVGRDSDPNFIDIDGDGDLDLIAGADDGSINFFENVGDLNTPRFIEQVGSNNPFDGVDVGIDSDPGFVDLDGDGDLDAIVGENDGNLNFFENTGDANNPEFTEQIGTENPFDGVDVADEPADSAPTFADLDGDGDLDAIIGVGGGEGTLLFFENTGDVNNPVFTKQIGADNPFDGIDVGDDSAPALIDIDGDGDLDAIVGEDDGFLNFFENTGDVNNPVFTEQRGLNNPFNGIDVGTDSHPTFGDIDGDGDLDLLVGEDAGNFNFFENTGPRETEINLEGTSLSITDVNGGNSPDTLSLKETETTLLIEDPNQAFLISNGIIFNSFNSAEVNLTSITEPIIINTLAGDDSIVTDTTLALNVDAGRGNDTVIGGQGNDTINGGQGADLIEGGDGNDRLLGLGSNDTLKGGSGDDSLNGGGGNDLLEGASGNDTLNGSSGNDTINGASGLDTILGGGGNDSLLGGSSNDLIIGAAGSDFLNGGQDDDTLNGGQGADTLNGGQGADTLNGGQGDDTLNGGNQNDLLLGSVGNDALNGGSGNDSLNGGSGNDLLLGSSGFDTLNGGSGNDTLNGGEAQDTLLGGVGNDTLNGGGAADHLIGGAGNDLLVGGADIDLLNGTDNVNFGVNERDTLIGGLGSEDRFQLGDSTGAYYLDDGAGGTSFARIQDFESIDKLILTGSKSDYRIATNGTTSAILKIEPGADDTIAVIRNTVGLDLNSDQFIFV